MIVGSIPPLRGRSSGAREVGCPSGWDASLRILPTTSSREYVADCERADLSATILFPSCWSESASWLDVKPAGQVKLSWLACYSTRGGLDGLLGHCTTYILSAYIIPFAGRGTYRRLLPSVLSWILSQLRGNWPILYPRRWGLQDPPSDIVCVYFSRLD